MLELDRKDHIAVITDDAVRRGADRRWAEQRTNELYDGLAREAVVDTFVPVLVRRMVMEELRVAARAHQVVS